MQIASGSSAAWGWDLSLSIDLHTVCNACTQTHITCLVGGLEHEFDFPFHIWDVILPIDELKFFKMVKTTNQFWLIWRESTECTAFAGWISTWSIDGIFNGPKPASVDAESQSSIIVGNPQQLSFRHGPNMSTWESHKKKLGVYADISICICAYLYSIVHMWLYIRMCMVKQMTCIYPHRYIISA